MPVKISQGGDTEGNGEKYEEDDSMLQVTFPNEDTSAFFKQRCIRFCGEIKRQGGSMRSLMWALAGANYQLMVKDEEIRKLKMMMGKGDEQPVGGGEECGKGDGLSVLSFLPVEVGNLLTFN